MVPTRDSGGASTSFFRGSGGGRTGAGSEATTGGGGRRDGEKIGRSRVTDNCLSGMAHNGLALSGDWDGGGGTTRTDVTGSVGDKAGGPASRVSSARPASSASVVIAGVATAPVGSNSTSQVRPIQPKLIIKLRLIWRLAIVRIPPGEHAACRIQSRMRWSESARQADRRTRTASRPRDRKAVVAIAAVRSRNLRSC